MTTAIRDIRSAACWRTLADLLLSRHRMVPQICGRYGFTRFPSWFTIVPKPLSITTSSVVCSWNAYRIPSISCSSRRESMSAAPRFPMIFSMVSITILRYCSFSSFRSSTTRLMISEAPTLLAISTVVSTSCL